MSYDIAIVDAPVPQDGAAAWQALDALFHQNGPVTAALHDVYEKLVARYPCPSTMADDDFDNHDSPWATGPFWGEFSGCIAHIPLIYSRADAALPFIVATAHSLGLTVFDLSETRIYRTDGLPGLTLEVEGQSRLIAPKLERILEAVDRMTPRGGPGFLVVNGPGGNYAQTAGGDGAYVLEWREYQGDGFRHWAAGHKLPNPGPFGRIFGRGSAAGREPGEIRVATNGFHVTARANEKLEAPEIKTLLTAFAHGSGRPTAFAWRDKTAEFDQS